MENLFGHKARKQRRGVKNFQNCTLKEVRVNFNGAAVRDSEVEAVLATCPTLEDSGGSAIKAGNTLIRYLGVKPEAASADAQKRLERVCGGSICADCVYVDMETPVQVYSHRTEIAQARLVAADAQKAALLAEAEVELAAQTLNPILEQ